MLVKCWKISVGIVEVTDMRCNPRLEVLHLYCCRSQICVWLCLIPEWIQEGSLFALITWCVIITTGNICVLMPTEKMSYELNDMYCLLIGGSSCCSQFSSIWVCSGWPHFRWGLIILEYIWTGSHCPQVPFRLRLPFWKFIYAGFVMLFHGSALDQTCTPDITSPLQTRF